MQAPRRNIELKASDPDPARSLAVCRALGAEGRGRIAQRDAYFEVARGGLKLREEQPDLSALWLLVTLVGLMIAAATLSLLLGPNRLLVHSVGLPVSICGGRCPSRTILGRGYTG